MADSKLEQVLNKTGLTALCNTIASIISKNYMTKSEHSKEIENLKSRMTEIEKHY